MYFICLARMGYNVGGGGGVLNRNFGRGVQLTRETLTLFKSQKCKLVSLPCLRESAVISYPV